MTQLLVSVRDAAEARAAMYGGADLIDIKEPRNGALGAAPVDIWRDVLEQVNDQAPVSCALGELSEPESTLVRRARDAIGMAFAKIGLAGWSADSRWPQRWRRIQSELPPRTELVAVVYADWQRANAPLPRVIVDRCAKMNCHWMLVDTFYKNSGGLFQILEELELSEITSAARDAGMQVVLAGSLTMHDVPRAASLEPDFIGVRGAACVDGREGRVAEELVRQLSSGLQKFLQMKFNSHKKPFHIA